MTALDRSLLAVTAHSDDETFIFGGTLARYAAEGVEVHLVVGCLDDRIDGSIRREEMKCVAEALGLASVTILDHEPPALPGDLSEPRVTAVAELVREQIERSAPRVVVTFDSTGGTGEADHILMGRATVTAFESMVSDEAEDQRKRKLYVGHFGKKLMRFGTNMLRLIPGPDPRHFGPGGGVDLVAALDASPSATTFIDVRRHLGIRRLAVECHQSQLQGAPWFLRRYERLPAGMRGALFRQEVYARVWPPAPAGLREEGFFEPDAPIDLTNDT